MSIFETTATDAELEEIRMHLDEQIAKFTIFPTMSASYMEFSRLKCLAVANAHFRKWKKENRSKLSLFDRFARINEVYQYPTFFRVKMPNGLNAEPML